MAKARILIVDDEPGMLDVCGETLSALPQAEIILEQDGRRAMDKLRREEWDLLIADVRMPDVDGTELLRHARHCDPDLVVLMLTAFPSVETAVASIKLGAAEYLSKPILPEDLLATCGRLLQTERLRDEHRLLARQVEGPYRFHDIIGKSAVMRGVFDRVRRLGPAGVDVLVQGEIGTGKELIARAIHRQSPRREQRFVPVDCGAIPEALMESEFFGHERGAFTGAATRSLGLLEFANGGTFFLDEIGQLSPRLQAKLLRVLQERRIRRVGGREELDVDVRVVAATSLDLETEANRGRFRADLFHRINVGQIGLPPLRDRREDIALLATHFANRLAGEMGRGEVTFDGDVLEVLSHYDWPGNVRELENTIKRVMAMAGGAAITAEDLPDELVAAAGQSGGSDWHGFHEQRAVFERNLLSDLLKRHDGDVTGAAAEARLPRATFYRLLKKHDLNPDLFRDHP